MKRVKFIQTKSRTLIFIILKYSCYFFLLFICSSRMYAFIFCL